MGFLSIFFKQSVNEDAPFGYKDFLSRLIVFFIVGEA